jgi:hypothetical protein
MSTDLYQVHVLSVTGDQVTCQVTAIYPDAALVPSPSLVVQFLWDVWERLQSGCVNDGGLSFGVKATVAAAEAKQLASHAAIGQLAGAEDGDEEWVQRNTGRIVRSVEELEQATRPARELGFSSADTYRSVTLKIVLTDPIWSSHLRPGMEWRTTAYVMDDAG